MFRKLKSAVVFLKIIVSFVLTRPFAYKYVRAPRAWVSNFVPFLIISMPMKGILSSTGSSIVNVDWDVGHSGWRET